MDSDGAKARTLQAFLNNKNYKLNVMCDDDETKNVFIAVLILLFELNVCEIGSADFDEEFTKLINDLSFGNLNKSFDKTDEDLIELGNGEIGDGVFLRRLYKSHPLSRTILIVDSSTKKKCDIMKDALPTGRIGQR